MLIALNHRLWTPDEGINQRNLKIWTDVETKYALPTVCRPVAKVDRLLDALQNYSAVNCFKNSITKVTLCL